MDIEYRIAAQNDVDDMAQFWSQNSGWDIIDANEWRRRFTGTPAGDAIAGLAIDKSTGRIIGQFVFIPTNFCVNGIQVRSFRPFAPILDVNLQTKFGISALLTGQHPLLKMYRIITNTLSDQGVPFVYYVPDPRWSRVLQAFPNITTHRFPLWSLSLPLSDFNFENDNIAAERIYPGDPFIDEFWETCKKNYTAWIVRNNSTMSWKSGFGDYRIFKVTSSGKPAGIFAAVYKAKDYQWLICDLIAADNNESLYSTLVAACKRVNLENNELQTEDSHPRKISVLVTPVMEPVLERLNFQKENYHFTLAVHRLNKEKLSGHDLHPSKWYVSAND